MHRYPSGATIGGHYTVTGLLGSGGSSSVYRARDTLLGRTVAVKVLDRDGTRLSTAGFMTEARAAALLSHPNIVNVYDILETPTENYIIMEYICGIPLGEYIRYHGHLSVKESVFATRQVLGALHLAHSRGIIHRDIKPGNMLLTTEGRIKVTDFGIARLPGKDSFLMPDRTVGTVHYVSPEQAGGRGTDERSDLYSLGIVMYEMLTGRRPFIAEKPADIAMLHLTKRPEPPTYYNPDIPRELEKIVLCALEKDPAARFDSAAEMIRVLDKLPESALSGRLRPVGEGASEYRKMAELYDESTDFLPKAAEGRRHLPEHPLPKGKVELVEDSAEEAPAEKKPARPLYDFSAYEMTEERGSVKQENPAVRGNAALLAGFSAEDTVDIMLLPKAEAIPTVDSMEKVEWEDEMPFFKRRPGTLPEQKPAPAPIPEAETPIGEDVGEVIREPLPEKKERKPLFSFPQREKTPKPKKEIKEKKSGKSSLLSFIGDHFYGVFAALAALLLAIVLLSSVLGEKDPPPPTDTTVAKAGTESRVIAVLDEMGEA